MFLSRDSLYNRHLVRQQNAMCCLNNDDRGSAGGVHPSASPSRLHSRIGCCHCGPLRWIWSPQTAFCILRQKNGWKHKTISAWDDDNYDIVIQCQSVWTCFFLSVSGFSASLCNILRAFGGFSPRPHRGSAPGPHWGTPCQCPSQTEILDPPFCTLSQKNGPLWLIWHNFTNSQRLLLTIFCRDTPYSILNWIC